MFMEDKKIAGQAAVGEDSLKHWLEKLLCWLLVEMQSIFPD